MASPNRQSPPSLIEDLLAAPAAFRFFQAVRLLELARQSADIGSSRAPAADPVRLLAMPSSTLPNSEIISLQSSSPEPLAAPQQLPDHRFSMIVSFMGLTGPSGVLPDHYTALVVERSHQQNKDFALREFFDLFNHRAITLFYLAWRKHRIPEEFERHRQNGREGSDRFSEMLYAIAGIGTPALRRRLAFRDHLAAFYGGLFSLRTRSAAGLRAMLRHFLQIPVQIQQFHERWLNLPEHSQSSLSSPQRPAGRNLQLGLETVVGTRVRDCQSCFRVVLGPLTRSRFESLLPGQILPQQIIDLIRLYAGPELDFEVQLLLVRADVPSLKFSPDTGSNRRLGWTTWLGTGTLPNAADDVVFRFSGLPTPA